MNGEVAQAPPNLDLSPLLLLLAAGAVGSALWLLTKQGAAVQAQTAGTGNGGTSTSGGTTSGGLPPNIALCVPYQTTGDQAVWLVGADQLRHTFATWAGFIAAGFTAASIRADTIFNRDRIPSGFPLGGRADVLRACAGQPLPTTLATTGSGVGTGTGSTTTPSLKQAWGWLVATGCTWGLPTYLITPDGGGGTWKRWIQDQPTFQRCGYTRQSIHVVDPTWLNNVPTGPIIASVNVGPVSVGLPCPVGIGWGYQSAPADCG
jgi:hypothetical protein